MDAGPPPPAQILPGSEIRKKGHVWRNATIVCGGLIAPVIAIAIIRWLSNPEGYMTFPTTIVLDKTGHPGTTVTASFTAAPGWQIDYSYDCSGLGRDGTFQIRAYGSNGLELTDVAVNELDTKASDFTFSKQGGKYSLKIYSDCSWHVIVKG